MPEAEAVDGEEALKRIRGEGEHAFDPKQTALLETSSSNLNVLTGGPLSSAASARFLKEDPNWLLIETSAETATVLIVSEMNYPGCEATVDGVPVAIYTTDYLLRGVIVPAGTHRI